MTNYSKLEGILDVLSLFQSGTVSNSQFRIILAENNLTLKEVAEIAGTNIFYIKEEMVHLTDEGKEWFYHLGYFIRRYLKPEI